MSKKVNNIHDKFVRESFSDPKRAAASLEVLLPEELKSHLQLSSLVILKESYMDEQLDEYFSDLVFEVPLAGEMCENLDIALLFEHKSSPDKHTLIQVGYYLFAHFHKCVVSKKPFKPVLPIIYYQGKKKWAVPTLSELFELYPDSIKEYLPSIPHVFIALHTVPSETLLSMKNSMMAAALIAQKNRFDPIKLSEDLRRILSLFDSEHEAGNFFVQTFVYVVQTSEIEIDEVTKIIASIPKPIQEEIMTTYTQLSNKFRQEGKIEGKIEGEQIGMQKGEQIGIQKGKIEVVLKSYESGIPISLIANITGLNEEEVAKILKEHGRVG